MSVSNTLSLSSTCAPQGAAQATSRTPFRASGRTTVDAALREHVPVASSAMVDAAPREHVPKRRTVDAALREHVPIPASAVDAALREQVPAFAVTVDAPEVPVRENSRPRVQKLDARPPLRPLDANGRVSVKYLERMMGLSHESDEESPPPTPKRVRRQVTPIGALPAPSLPAPALPAPVVRAPVVRAPALPAPVLPAPRFYPAPACRPDPVDGSNVSIGYLKRMMGLDVSDSEDESPQPTHKRARGPSVPDDISSAPTPEDASASPARFQTAEDIIDDDENCGDSADLIDESDGDVAAPLLVQSASVLPLVAGSLSASANTPLPRDLVLPAGLRKPRKLRVDLPDAGEASFEIDPAILIERKERFRQMAVAFVWALSVWASHIFDPGFAPWLSGVTFVFAAILSSASQEYLVHVICTVVIDQAQYLISDPDFHPRDLALLPKVSRKDVVWGCYFDIISCNSGPVPRFALYCGSAIGQFGLLGRLFSYFTGSSSIQHDEYVRDPEWQPSFHKAADMHALAGLHLVYTLLVETFLMVVTEAFDTNTEPHRYMSADTPSWVIEIRKEMGVVIHDDVIPLNRALPCKQGVRRDPRFQSSKICSNPDAVCPTTTGAFAPLTRSEPMNLDARLCSVCSGYFKCHGQHRTQLQVDRLLLQNAREGCGWCYKDLISEVSRSANSIVELGIVTCHPCYSQWTGHCGFRLVPIPGIHVPEDHIFACDKCATVASQKWFFEKSFAYEGSLHCLRCHNSVRPNMRVECDADAPKVRVDYSHWGNNNKAGFLLYTKRVFRIDLLSIEAIRAQMMKDRGLVSTDITAEQSVVRLGSPVAQEKARLNYFHGTYAAPAAAVVVRKANYQCYMCTLQYFRIDNLQKHFKIKHKTATCLWDHTRALKLV